MGPSGDFIEEDADFEELVDMADLEAERKAIFLVGRIDYQDVFRGRQTTDFCFCFMGKLSAEGEQMSAYDEGNDST